MFRLRRNGTAPDAPAGARRRTRGQSLVEFALVLPILMLLLLGAIQFGIIWATQVGVTNAVRDAVRAASGIQPKLSAVTGVVDTATEQSYAASIRTNVLLPALSRNVPFYGEASLQSSQICYASFTDASEATALKATGTVTYGHPIIMPLIAGLLGSNQLRVVATLEIPVGLDKPFSLPASGTTGCSP